MCVFDLGDSYFVDVEYNSVVSVQTREIVGVGLRE